MNAALEAAMADAWLTPRQLAHRVGVNPKQVERWLGDGAPVPHTRNRVEVCRALGVAEEMIWPKIIRDRVKAGNDRELSHSYPYRSACPSTVWTDLTERAEEEIFLAGYTNYFVWTQIPRFADTVRRKAAEGVRIRFLLGDPDGEVTRQREDIEDVAFTVSTRIRITLENLARLETDSVEARFSSPADAMNHVGLSVFRFDEEALVTPHLARVVGHDSPLLHLRRTSEEGLFARFAEHAEELWGRARPV